MLQVAEQLRYLERSLAGGSTSLATVAMQAIALGLPVKSQADLVAQVLETSVDRAFMQQPLPADASTFGERREAGRARLSLIAQEVARLLQAIVLEMGACQRKLGLAKAWPAVTTDLQQQLAGLFAPRFLCDTAPQQLGHYPRYLKAIGVRIDKLRTDPARDARLQAELTPLLVRLQRETASRKGQVDPALVDLRWLIEELRVGLFAQELRTPTAVSIKRVEKVFESLQR
jgi:ATP-dependent helicase HrpA